MNASPTQIVDQAQIEGLAVELSRFGACGAEIVDRYNRAVNYSIPWVDRVAPLSDTTVIEIGCGSGSATAAFAPSVKHIYGYDFEDHLIRATEARARFLGLQNLTARLSPAEATSEYISNCHPEGVDIVLLYAVLEHCMPKERLDILRSAWSILRPGGHLVVIETPNRLTYDDYHTTQMPFFHMLPTELALRCYSDSSRKEIIEYINRRGGDSVALYRAGLGASFHEFQIGLGEKDLSKILVADGFEPEMLAQFPMNLEDHLLATFFLEYKVDVPLGFVRRVLNLIFRRSDGQGMGAIDPNSRRLMVKNLARGEWEGRSNQAAVYEAFGDMENVLFSLSESSVVNTCNIGPLSQSGGRLVFTAVNSDPQLYLSFGGPPVQSETVAVVDMTTPAATMVQAFFDLGRGMNEKDSFRSFVSKGRSLIAFEVPIGARGGLRFDPGIDAGLYQIHTFDVRIK